MSSRMLRTAVRLTGPSCRYNRMSGDNTRCTDRWKELVELLGTMCKTRQMAMSMWRNRDDTRHKFRLLTVCRTDTSRCTCRQMQMTQKDIWSKCWTHRCILHSLTSSLIISRRQVEGLTLTGTRLVC